MADRAGNTMEFGDNHENVLIIPGNVFSNRDTHFRLSYATTDAKLEQGLEILRKLARE